MSDDDLIIYECSRHTLDEHVRAHEAGHAVAAIEYGIPFRGLIVYGEGDEPRIGDLMSAAAQVVMHSADNSTWVRPDPVAALRFACAGHGGEVAVLDDLLPDSARGDMQAWRAGYSNVTKALNDDEVDEALGTPRLTIYIETLDWARAKADDIRRLAAHLGALPASTEMPYEEVVALVRS